MSKVAIITGGASGIGLAAATALVARDWHVHLLDINAQDGKKALETLRPNASFHLVNITDYESLSSTFDNIFKTEGRLDFVFANAGKMEHWSFDKENPLTGPAPPPDLSVIDLNFTAVVTTSYLALHYFRQSPSKNRSLIYTSSAAGIYSRPSTTTALYSGAKHGIVALMRCLAEPFNANDIRINSICPFFVATKIMGDESGFDMVPKNLMTPIETVVDLVLALVDGNAMIDAKGKRVEAGNVFGQTLEINKTSFHFREPYDYVDEATRQMVEGLAGEVSAQKRE